METCYWKATVDKPFSVEYANDMPGSAFVPVSPKKNGGSSGGRETGEGLTVGETAWNMRGVSRAEGSLLRFMKEEIPGVTSPMVYIAMMFSWFAWHVEDHDLHSLNYLHMGAGKTWYGVPREASVAFEEVVRVHGYGGELNPLVTFATLGEKTTVMSPEVFISAGVPCCRLVQNPGEFVVTFPRAYHSGFSHGFNCGEAANIATPEWLRVAKDAAIRRASINYPPMVSHFQLLYDLALALCSRLPMTIDTKPRSSRLKDKKKGEGETLVKELFVQNVMQNNNLLQFLGQGSSVVLLPQSSSDISVCSDLRVGSQVRANPNFSIGLYNYKDLMKSSEGLDSDSKMLGSNDGIKPIKSFYPFKGKFASFYERNRNSSLNGNKGPGTLTSQSLNTDIERESTTQGDGLSDQRLFSCVTCGILSFACVAIVQPREPAARYLMSNDCSFFNDWTVGSGVTSGRLNVSGGNGIAPAPHSRTRWTERGGHDGLYDVPVQSVDYQIQMVDQSTEVVSDAKNGRHTSALGLLALNYGDSSDSEDDQAKLDGPFYAGETILTKCSSEEKNQCDNSRFPCDGATEGHSLLSSRHDCQDEASPQIIDCCEDPECGRPNFKVTNNQISDSSVFEPDNLAVMRSNGLEGTSRDPVTGLHATSSCSQIPFGAEKSKFADMPFAQKCDEDSSRMHVFCLEHAMEVEQQLRPIGGVHVMLLCHPEYPRIEAEAKAVAGELGMDCIWNDIRFCNATKEDEERIQSALDCEEVMPANGDWAVKLGINLFYSAILSRSALYAKQMPYNSVIYNAFGRSSPASSPTKPNAQGRRSGKQKKVVVGKWCGKVWMSNQVHPFLVQWDPEEQEEERIVHARQVPNVNLESRPDNVHRIETTSVIRKSSRKRKTTGGIGPIKKVKYTETEDAVSDDSLENSSYKHHEAVLRSKQTKYFEREDGVSCDSLEQSPLRQYVRNSRRKQAKSIEREDALSDDALEDSSHSKHRRIIRRKVFKRYESDDAVSDDSLVGSSHLRHRRSLGNKSASFIQREEAVSDDALGDDSHQQHRRIPRGKQNKPIERDFAVSDDSMEDDPEPQHRSVLRNKQSKFVEMDDAVSYDSPEDNSRRQHRRIPRSKKAKFIDREDAASYDSLEDDSHQQCRRISKGKQAKLVDREDAESYDSLDDNSHQQLRRIPRSKQKKHVDREDAYDSVEDTSLKQHRSLRSKQKKPQTARQTPQQRKQGKRLAKQQTSRKKKQETPRHQNDRSQRNVGQFDSYVEEELEGGPSTRLRKRISKPAKDSGTKVKEKKPTAKKKGKSGSGVKALGSCSNTKLKDEEAEHQCDMEGCTMSFGSKQELALHKRNICPVKGCGKKFFSHKYLVQHRRVHMDDRPLKCPWKGCKMTFKWAWARTEHIRVHTGARPYVCAEPGCGQTFRFVSDFSRHKRKTGHSAKKARG